MSFNGGKDKYMSLLVLIKRESPALYDVINELCMDGTFRSQRFQNTFLMPSKSLVKKLEDLVANDKDEQAIDLLRSLILKRHYELSDFKTKDIVMGTLQSSSRVLKDPAEVGKLLKSSKKTVYSSKTGAPTFTVYEYTGDDFPKTVGGESGGMILATKTMKGGSDNNKVMEHLAITKGLIQEGDASTTIDNFFRAVSGLLSHLQSNDAAGWDIAKFYLCRNPILSWYFLTLPGTEYGLVSHSTLKDMDFTQGIADSNLTNECIENNYSLNKEVFQSINNLRSKLVASSDKSLICQSIKDAYNKMLPEMKSKNCINPKLASNVEMKMLMDELRFQYEDCVTSWEGVDDTLTALRVINWAHPNGSAVLTNDDIYRHCLIKPTEAVSSGPSAFVRSVYFLYMPLTESIEDQLVTRGAGSIRGGSNPNAINSLIFNGGAAKKKAKACDIKMESFVKMLSKSQRQALKGML